MTVSRFEQSPDGSSKLLNFFPMEGGSVIRKEADMNAVVTQVFEAPQEDGTMEYRTATHIVCKDPEMLPALEAIAKTRIG